MKLIFILFFNQVLSISSSCFTHNATGVADFYFEYKVDLVHEEFIVAFEHFFERNIRENYLNAILSYNRYDRYTILNHTAVDGDYPSDFDVLRVASAGESSLNVSHFVEALKSHPYVKSVTPQRRLTRTLKQYDEEEEEDDDVLVVEENYEEVVSHKKRQLNRAVPKSKHIVDVLDATTMWKMGYTGQHVNVAVFDTGLEANHPHFRNVIERNDWTSEKNPDDLIGHGTFVAGVIASSKECLGLAPDVNLYIFKVFTKNQVSYTSWFLEAFNHAIRKSIDVLNLSIGGPDFMDLPFVDKVWQLTSNNVVMVSAIGNDGPLYGTLNNPADQMDVIGVGGINFDDQIARFSSRGMTTWELPSGYGRVKPDIVTYGTSVRSSNRGTGCRTLSGTSVASPVVAGAVALILSAFKHRDTVNPASVKQALMHSADRIQGANMFEQGHGKLNLIKAYDTLNTYKPQVSLSPSYIDFTECPYMWPYCTQPLYHTGLPVIVNVTLLNGLAVTGKVVKRPQWQPFVQENGECLQLSISYSEKLWPWSGYMAISMTVSEECQEWEGVVQGLVILTVESQLTRKTSLKDDSITKRVLTSEVKLPIKVKIIPTPLRKQRLLWDQYHNLRYPPGYFPRDNLRMKDDPLDWNADHLHTNFKDMYDNLKNAGYFIEILGYPLTCFEANNYGTLLIVDTEEEFSEKEIEKLKDDIVNKALSVIVFAEWFNTTVMQKAKFFDENTGQWWIPDTGGANIPALNDLLSPFEIAFSDRIYDGEYMLNEKTVSYSSGASILKFPRSKNSYVMYRDLNDQGEDFLKDKQVHASRVPILGLHQVESADRAGRVVAYGDSNCLDSSHLQKDCFWMLLALLEYTCNNITSRIFMESTSEQFPHSNGIELPLRMNETNFHKYSRLNQNVACPVFVYETPLVVNETAPKDNLYKHQRLMSINLADESVLQAYQNNKLQSKLMNNFINYDDNRRSFVNYYLQFDDSKFPIITFIAVILVLTFFAYKFYKFKTRKRVKRSLFLTNEFQQKLNKKSPFHRSVSSSSSTRNSFNNGKNNVAKYNSRLNNI